MGGVTEAPPRAATPADVDTVVIDGRILKRGGRLNGIDVPAVVGGARSSLAAVRARAGWR